MKKREALKPGNQAYSNFKPRRAVTKFVPPHAIAEVSIGTHAKAMATRT